MSEPELVGMAPDSLLVEQVHVQFAIGGQLASGEPMRPLVMLTVHARVNKSEERKVVPLVFEADMALETSELIFRGFEEAIERRKRMQA